MKRLWLGVAILLILLIVSGGVTWFMDDFHDALSRELALASQAAAREDWAAVLTHTRRAEDSWRWGKRLVAAVADHEPLEQVDNVFAQLRIYAQLGQAEEYAVLCAHLSELAQALGDSQGLTWWNLL